MMYRELIEQIDWEMYRRDHWKVDDLKELKRKIREARDNGTIPEFTNDEKYQLKGMITKSINKIQNYVYGEGIDAEKMRKESLEPLYQLLAQIQESK